jgi:hypothetical protein
VAKYQVNLRDVWPFLRRRLLRSGGTALLILVVASALAIVSGGGEPELGILGMGVGAASALLADAYLEYQRTRQLYGAHADTIELAVSPSEIVFATDTEQTTVRRSPKVSVRESSGAFLIAVGTSDPPLLVPVRCLDASERDALRQWITR